MVQEYDTVSTKGLVYYSLRPTTISKDVLLNEQMIEKKDELNTDINFNRVLSDGSILIASNTNIELSTEDGYFETNNSNIKVLKRTSSKIIFSMPFGLEEVTIKIKQKGDIVSQTYRVV